MNPKVKRVLLILLVIQLSVGIELELTEAENMESCTIIMSTFDVCTQSCSLSMWSCSFHPSLGSRQKSLLESESPPLSITPIKTTLKCRITTHIETATALSAVRVRRCRCSISIVHRFQYPSPLKLFQTHLCGFHGF